MKRVRSSVLGKSTVCALLLCAVLMGSVFGLYLFCCFPYYETENWRESSRYYNLMWAYCEDIASYYADSLALEQNSRFYIDGSAQGETDSSAEERDVLKETELTYVDRQNILKRMEEFEQKMAPGATHFLYQVKTSDGSEVLMDNGKSLRERVDEVRYYTFIPGNYFDEPEVTYQMYENAMEYESTDARMQEYVIEYGVLKNVNETIDDDFSRLKTACEQARRELSCWLSGLAICVAVAAVSGIYLLWSAGYKAGSEEIVLKWQDKLWFEVYLSVAGGVAVALFALALLLLDGMSWQVFRGVHIDSMPDGEMLLMGAGVCACITASAGACMLLVRTVVVRLKGRAMARSTLLCRVLTHFWKVLRWTLDAAKTFLLRVPFLWKTILGFSIYFFGNIMLFPIARYGRNGVVGLLWYVLNLGALLLLCWWSLGFQRLRRGSRAISAGELSHQINTNRMPPDLKQHAENLNNLTIGLQEAVEQRLRSERFKAELITNVSHDLKTPLTSIINYVDLLKSTQQTDPKAAEYIEVLDRKSQRLKKLTEDLVEASKASTGTLKVEREKLSMAQLVDQALGEYEEKLHSRGLSVITSLTEEDSSVYADGRHLWRVLDNLLSNCCKYAMANTRVYLELTRGKGQVVLTVKNISREPLNVPSEQLMERFVRGDASRSTEGSGLGLSIARSLTELQGGTFELAVDGDLFKAIVTMPQAG